MLAAEIISRSHVDSRCSFHDNESFRLASSRFHALLLPCAPPVNHRCHGETRGRSISVVGADFSPSVCGKLFKIADARSRASRVRVRISVLIVVAQGWEVAIL